MLVVGLCRCGLGASGLERSQSNEPSLPFVVRSRSQTQKLFARYNQIETEGIVPMDWMRRERERGSSMRGDRLESHALITCHFTS